jgi:hypothetical protein
VRSNGEVEGPFRSAQQAPRAHDLFRARGADTLQRLLHDTRPLPAGVDKCSYKDPENRAQEDKPRQSRCQQRRSDPGLKRVRSLRQCTKRKEVPNTQHWPAEPAIRRDKELRLKHWVAREATARGDGESSVQKQRYSGGKR